MQRKPDEPGITAILYKEPIPSPWYRSLDLSPSQLTLLGFAVTILLGALILWLPLSVAQEHEPNFLTALFISTSAVCVTGLVVVDPGTYFSTFGQVVVLLLIQIGGLGYMTIYTIMLMAVGKRFSLRERLALQEVLDLPGPGGVIRFILRVLAATLVIETIGTLFLAAAWVPEFGWGRGLYLSLFHAVSAFNNAGFSLFPDNLMSFRTHVPVILPVAILVILGGLGYPVMNELWQRLVRSDRHFSWRQFSLNTRVGLIAPTCLLTIGTLMVYLFEYRNPATLGNLSWWDQLLSAFFQAVVPRTAGFNSIDTASLSNASLFFLILLMFIGTNPGGTGGGVKTTTLAVLLAQALAVIQGKPEVTLQQRRLNTTTLRKAATTFLISWSLINVVSMILAITEQKDFLRLMFETVSAFGTVGLSANITPTLSTVGQILIVFTMYAGRVGVITLGTAIWTKHRRSAVQYAEESLLVG